MKKLYTLLVFAFALSFSACNDDFLERVPETSIGAENFFNTEADLNIYINGLYNFPGSGMYTADAATDNAATTGNTELKTMMVSNPTSSTITSGWSWGRLRSINLFLANFGRANISEEKLNHFEGLGRFFRAQFYMDKVKRYSDVPYYDFVIETSDEDALMKARDPRTFVVDKIFEDYQYAVDHIFESQPDGAVDRWVAKAFMARAALYEGTYRKYHAELSLANTANTYLEMARDLSLDIIENGPFSLHSTGNPNSDYAALFNSTDLSSNSEVILAVYSEDQVVNSGWWEFMFGNYEMSPAKDLIQAYLMNDGSYYSQQAGYETKTFVEEFENRDPRMAQTFAYPGFELVYTSTYAQGAGVYVQQLGKSFSGYHQLKGFVNSREEKIQNSLDFPIIRLAEMMLTYAEAQAELGAITQSDLDMTVNQLRDRVNMPHLSVGVASDSWQQTKYVGISPLLAEIRRERRVELAMEGFRHDDVMRWNAAKLFEAEPQGIYFSGLGEHDLTGDGIADIVLLSADESIPDTKATNALGVQLVYYKAGTFGQSVGVYLSNGSSGYVQTVQERGTFEAPKFYYRPVPAPQVALNPNLEQIFGW